MQSSRLSWRARPLALLALALAAACGDDGPSAPDPNPAPAVTAVSPGTVQAGSAEATLTVTGSRFIAQSTVRFNGAERTTEFVSATELRARLTAADLAAAGTAQVAVFSPAPGGGVSNAAELVVANPAPAVASLSPGSVVVGSPGATVTLVGTGFVATSEVRAGGAARPTTYVSATELRVALTAADLAAAGPAQLTVFNPAPGGGDSSAAVLAVDNSVPAITAISPGAVAAGSAGATVTLTGTGFVPQSRVLTGTVQRQSAYVSATQLAVTLTAAEVAAGGTLELRVENPAPGGGTSNAVALVVANPRPTVTLVDPDSVPQGIAAEVTVRGTGFVPRSEVILGVIPRRTVYVSPTELRAMFSVEDMTEAATWGLEVRNPGPGGGTSPFRLLSVVAPMPAIDSVSPNQVVRRPEGVTVRIFGSGFIPQSRVSVNTLDIWPSTYVSPTELRIELTANDVLTLYAVGIRVTNPSPGGGMTQHSRNAHVFLLDPASVITSLLPAQAAVGQPGLTLRLNGTGFLGEI
jgi:hypothetical protein